VETCFHSHDKVDLFWQGRVSPAISPMYFFFEPATVSFQIELDGFAADRYALFSILSASSNWHDSLGVRPHNGFLLRPPGIRPALACPRIASLSGNARCLSFATILACAILRGLQLIFSSAMA